MTKKVAFEIKGGTSEDEIADILGRMQQRFNVQSIYGHLPRIAHRASLDTGFNFTVFVVVDLLHPNTLRNAVNWLTGEAIVIPRSIHTPN